MGRNLGKMLMEGVSVNEWMDSECMGSHGI